MRGSSSSPSGIERSKALNGAQMLHPFQGVLLFQRLMSIWQQVWLLTSIGLPALWSGGGETLYEKDRKQRRVSIAVGLTNWIGPYLIRGRRPHILSYSARPCAPLPIKDCLQWDSAWHKLALLKPIQGYKITRAEALVKGHPL